MNAQQKHYAENKAVYKARAAAWAKNNPDRIAVIKARCYKNTHDKRRAGGAARARARKASAINMYSDGTAVCKWCGQGDLDVLCLDHIDNSGNKKRGLHGTGDDLYRWVRNNDYPDGFQVLCCNCNRKKENIRRRTARLGQPDPEDAGWPTI